MNETLWQKARTLAARPYTFEVSSDQLSNGQTVFLARNPELPGCLSQGDTVEEALANVNDARVDYIYSLLEDQLPVPSPLSSVAQTGDATSFIKLSGTMQPSPELKGQADELTETPSEELLFRVTRIS